MVDAAFCPALPANELAGYKQRPLRVNAAEDSPLIGRGSQPGDYDLIQNSPHTPGSAGFHPAPIIARALRALQPARAAAGNSRPRSIRARPALKSPGCKRRPVNGAKAGVRINL